MLRAFQRLINSGVFPLLPDDVELRKSLALFLRKSKRKAEAALLLPTGLILKNLLNSGDTNSGDTLLNSRRIKIGVPRIPREKVSRILVMQGGQRIGDIIVAMPVTAWLKRYFVDAELTAYASPELEDLVRLDPNVDDFIPDTMDGKKTWLAALRTKAAEIRSKSYDLAVILSIQFTDPMIALDAAIPYRLGYNYNRRGWPLNISPKPHPSCNRSGWEYPGGPEVPHIIDFWGALLNYAGVKTGAPDWSGVRANLPRNRVSKWLTRSGIASSKKLVILHPKAGISSRSLPAEKTVEILRGLAGTEGVVVIITGSPQDAQGLRGMASAVGGQAHCAAGELSLIETWALVDMAQLFIGVDTGVLHMAAASQVPSISIFGPGDPWIWGPYGQLEKVIHGDEQCLRCKRSSCVQTSLRCMNSIPVQSIIQSAKAMVK